jgi:hypothetical protein
MVQNSLDAVKTPKNYKGDADKYINGKRRLVLHKLFAGEMGGPKYADPAARFSGKFNKEGGE